MATERIEIYDGARTCRPIPLDAARDALARDGGTVWLHVVGGEHEARRELFESLGLFELHIEDALSNTERPSLAADEDGLFLVLPTLDEGSPELAIWMRPGGLVSYLPVPVAVVDAAYDRWRTHPAHLGESPPSLLHEVVDSVVDTYLPAIDALEDEIDDVVDRIVAGKTGTMADVIRMKRDLLTIRRTVLPARDVVAGMIRRDNLHIPSDMRPYFQDVYDHILRDLELIEMNRETLGTALELHIGKSGQRLNEVLKRMTVSSLMLMAPALVAGVYGMNFERMPELRSPYGYPAALGLMVLSSLLVYGYFRLRGWIGPERE